MCTLHLSLIFYKSFHITCSSTSTTSHPNPDSWRSHPLNWDRCQCRVIFSFANLSSKPIFNMYTFESIQTQLLLNKHGASPFRCKRSTVAAHSARRGAQITIISSNRRRPMNTNSPGSWAVAQCSGVWKESCAASFGSGGRKIGPVRGVGAAKPTAIDSWSARMSIRLLRSNRVRLT